MSKRRSAVLLVPLGAIQLLGALVTAGALLGWGRANPFRYLTDPLLLQLDNPELNLLLGLTTYLISTVFLIAVLEAGLLGQHGRGRQSLLGLLPVVGVAIPLFFWPRTQMRDSSWEIPATTGGRRVPAAILMGLAGGMVLLGVLVVAQIEKPLEPPAYISASEANHAAFLAVTEIAEAQTAYRKSDWDGDGQKEFALFVVHLWRTGRKNAEPVDVNLIPEDLAVARNSDFAHRGYSFRNLHCRTMGDEASHQRELDYSKEWALFAEPEIAAQEDENEKRLQFIALSDGRFFARQYQPDAIRCIPLDLEKQWSPISSSADISRLTKPSMGTPEKFEFSAN
jgi:hypothetical protein